MEPDFLHKPIPGISLTGELGNAPWEQPPKYVSLDDVIDFYSDKLIDEDTTKYLVKTIKNNVPLMTIADGLVRMGIMEGIHTIDSAMLVKPVLIELMVAMAEIYDIEYIIEADDMLRQRVVPSDVVERVVAQTTEKIAEVKEESVGMVARRKK